MSTHDHDVRLADGRVLRTRDRVVAAALVSLLAPYDAPGLDWSADMANGAVQAPVSVWSGEQDTDTPAAHARWLATAVPGAELCLFHDEGICRSSMGGTTRSSTGSPGSSAPVTECDRLALRPPRRR
jgi:pimeloyl-ACP methyl ester carboxylesterase